jgi:hydrogenase expression/formation protein HypE
MFLNQFRSSLLEPLHDGAIIPIAGERIAFTTDSYVVQPIFFPGGDIGELSVNGTVNDLAMCGATPRFLSAAFIIEEGLPMEDLWRVVVSMEAAAKKAGVELVTGDTKVVDRGKGDKIFINTSGIGIIPEGIHIGPKRAMIGDKIIVNGALGQHGMAIMSVREGLEFETTIRSDTAPLNGLVKCMLDVCKDVHVLRDPTRGGLAGVLNEIAESSNTGILIQERLLPIDETVRGACEILGLDPLYVANEGRLVAFVPSEKADAVLSAMKSHELGRDAAVIGDVVADHRGTVVMKSKVGGLRVVDMLSGEQLPRIC